MMTRAQRIDYELLDCAIHGFRDSRGYATAATTTVPAFLKRLRVLFPALRRPPVLSDEVHNAPTVVPLLNVLER